MKIKKKICLIALLLGAVILIACLGNVIIPKTSLTSGEIKNMPLIIIDAGHGGLTNTIMAIFFETVQPHCFGAKS